jgi:hypothetical protein
MYGCNLYLYTVTNWELGKPGRLCTPNKTCSCLESNSGTHRAVPHLCNLRGADVSVFKPDIGKHQSDQVGK